MNISNVIDGTHITTSPSGLYIASIASCKLRLHATSAPDRFSEFSFRVPEKDVTAVKWAKDSTQVLLFSPQLIEVLDLQDPSHRVRLDNGSGGLGRFASADFVNDDLVFVVWEFGRSKLWNLRTGKGIDLNDVKARAGGSKWQIRPCIQGRPHSVIAMLSRSSGEDFLTLYFPESESSMPMKKLATVDARSLSWSADGKWIVIVDSTYALPFLHIHTADGHRYRTYGPASQGEMPDPGLKEAIWSADRTILAVPKNDGTVPLLNTRTFSPIATIEHNTTIDQAHRSTETQASIWEEVVSATGERFYRLASQPYSPPLTHSLKVVESNSKGVAECQFSCDGSYLATRDERMLNTVWVWNVGNLAAHAVIVLRSIVRHVQWHPTRPSTMLVDCGEGLAHLYNASDSKPPEAVSVPVLAGPSLSWVYTAVDDPPIILATTKTAFRVVYPEGRDMSLNSSRSLGTITSRGPGAQDQEEFEEGHSEDSLFDVLSGRKAQHSEHGREMSYTERIDLETEEEDSTARLDDTFREKRPTKALAEELDKDPLDDSQIF